MIDKVFSIYEVLFNELDRISTILQNPTHSDHKWMTVIYLAVVEMKIKLKRYYAKTEHPYVYGNSLILSPKWKLNLFKQDSWEEGSLEKYRDQCRQLYLDDYHYRMDIITDVALSTKRSWKAVVEDDADSDEEYEHLRSHAPEDESTTFNEFDHYISLLIKKQATLAYWQTNVTTFPKLSLMAWDCFAVSVTDVEVEGQFSHSE